MILTTLSMPSWNERAEALRSLGMDALAPGKRVAVYGAGLIGRWSIPWLRGMGANVVACFDADPAKNGHQISGVEILSPRDIHRISADIIFVATRHAVKEALSFLEGIGAPAISLDAFCAARLLPDFERLKDTILEDDRSRETLDGVIEAMISGDVTPCGRILEGDQYFSLPAFRGKDKEVYVDAGAYVGDSVERFIWVNYGVFEKIYAFEPGGRQFKALRVRIDRLCAEWALDRDAVQLIQSGLSDRAIRVEAGTANSQLQSLALRPSEFGDAETVRLDDILSGARITFLKADVEGMEIALLDGAAETIRRWKPKLAICAYHYPNDILDIIAKIRSIMPSYRFALRHHSPRLLETVLYGWHD